MVILCTIDLETREVSLPAGQVIASYDHNVDVIRFQAETVPGFSLNTSTIRIAAQGPNKARHDYAVDPSTVSIEEETGYITFDWPIPAGVTEMPIGAGFKYGDRGQLIFAVCAEIISGSTVSKAWHSDDGIITVVAHLEPESGGGEDPSETATNAQKIAQLQTDVAVINTQVDALGNGSPTPVATVAEMTDESAVYLYTGSETGYTAGNWYYYDGSAWTSGGTYGGAVTDTTLSISGSPADSKTVGDALAEKADAYDVESLTEDAADLKGDLRSALNAIPYDIVLLSGGIKQRTHNGVTFAPKDNGTGCTINGTASANAFDNVYANESALPEGVKPGDKLRFYVATTKPSTLRCVVIFFDSSGTEIDPTQYIHTNKEITIPINAVGMFIRIQVQKDAIMSNDSISLNIYRSIYDLQALKELRTTDNDKDYRIGRLSTPDTVDGYVFLDPADWEIGGFNYSFEDDTITYGANLKRIRTKENFGYPVRAGDVIGLYDYTGFYIYIVIKDATTGVFRGAGAKTSDYKVPFDGYAYIYVAKVSDEVYISNVYDYLSKVFIRKASSVISDYKSTTASGRQFVLSHQYGTPVFVPAETENIIVCGKNMFRTPHGVTTFTNRNVTKTFNEKLGTIVVSSEGASGESVAPDVYSTVNGVSWNCLYKFKLPSAMDVVFSANADKDLYLYGDIRMQISDGAKSINVYNEPVVFKAEANKEYGIRIWTSASYSGTVTFRPQVEINKTYPAEFEPFKGVIVDDNGNVTNINTLSDSLDNGVLIDSYTATVISYDDAVTVGYECVRDTDYGYMLYNLNNKKPDYRQPMISFIDDDTTNTTFVENYYNVMHDIGVVGNFAAVTKKISESDALKTMLLGYEADGFGVLLHCYNQAGASTDYFRPGPTDRDIEQVRDNMITGLRAINEFGFISKDYWVTPYGVNDPDIKAVAKSLGLKAVISTLNNTPNIHGVTDRYSIGRYSFAETESSINENLPCIKRGMDACIANGGWIIVTTHANEWGDAVEAVSDALSEIVTYANTIGMKVVNFQEGFETYFG